MTRLWVIAVLTVGIVVACDRVPLTSPTGSTIALTVDRDILPINGQATITAVVSEVTGLPVHNGTLVTFQTSLGRTDPIEAETVNGKATVTFLAGAVSGTANISAFSGAARTGSGNSSAGGVSVKIGTAGVDRIAVRTDPVNVPISGGTVTVIATLFDAGGNPIINTPVTFSSDFGSLSSNSATTDSNGEARVSLTTNRTTIITAAAGAGKDKSFTLNALNPPTITISCGSSSNGTAGIPVSCTLKPTAAVISGNGSSSAPIQNVTITWGDGSGEQPLGAIASGSESAVQHTFAQAGTYSVTAAVIDANSQRGSTTISVVVVRSTPSGFSMSCPSSAITVGSPGSFTFKPASSPAVPISNVTVDFGDGTSRNLGAPTADQSFLKSYSSDGGYTVIATVTDITGQKGTSSCGVIVNRASAITVTFTQDTTTVKAGTVAAFTVSASGGTGNITNIRVTNQDGDQLYSGGAGSFTWTPKSGGTAVLTAVATDSAGNTGNKILVITVSP